MTMKTLFRNTILRLTIVALLLVSVAACSKRGGVGGKDSNIDYWTCTMHPWVHSRDPGKCPTCLMNLVPVMKSNSSGAAPVADTTPKKPADDKGAGMENMPGMKGGDMKPGQEKPGDFVVPVERQQQIGVTYATVETKPLNHTIRAIGRVVPETQRVWRVVSRTSAYVQELGVNAPGELVKKNQVLMKL